MRLIAAILAVTLLTGCSVFQRDEQAQTTERTVETPLANGGKLTVREMRTDTTAHSGLDDALVANMAKIGASAATGDWGTIIGVGGTALAAAAAGFAKSKHAEAQRQYEEVERQRADADYAWRQLVPHTAQDKT